MRDFMFPDAYLPTHLHMHRHIHTEPTAVQIRVNIPIVSQQWKSLLGFVQKEFFSYSFIYCLLMLSYYCSHS